MIYISSILHSSHLIISHPLITSSITTAHLFTSPKLIEKRSSPRNLTISEPIHARIVAVIHPVVDRVNTTTGARVLANRAAGSDSLLGRGVSDRIAGARAAALEDVVETEPVADFVGGGGALVEGSGGAAGKGVCEVDAAVEGFVGGRGGGGGEVAPGSGVNGLVDNGYSMRGVLTIQECRRECQWRSKGRARCSGPS